MGHRNTRETQYECWTIPIQAGRFSREDLAAFVAGSMKDRAVAVSLIVEHHLAGLGFAAADALTDDVLAHQRYQFCSQDGPDDWSRPCPACGRLMPPLRRDPASDLCRMHPDSRAVIWRPTQSAAGSAAATIKMTRWSVARCPYPSPSRRES